jgi:hypothetical protein
MTQMGFCVYFRGELVSFRGMGIKLAVAIIHGIGRQPSNFADGIIEELKDRFAGLIGQASPDARAELEMEPVYWAPVLQDSQDELWKRLRKGGELDFLGLRKFMVSFAGDAIAYQPAPKERAAYEAVHQLVAERLAALAGRAGPSAPLCVIAHSLGTVIASNYFYDLQADPRRKLVAPKVRRSMGLTPLEKGETLTALYTMGSPIALWSLRYREFGRPIAVPSEKLGDHHPNLSKASEWINFYDEDDVIGYPLRTLNDAYRAAVKEDKQVNSGGLLSSWNPLSHNGYWTDNDVTKPIASSLARIWRAANP